MKFIHLSDLHLGKKINEASLIDDQKYILSQIIKIIDNDGNIDEESGGHDGSGSETNDGSDGETNDSNTDGSGGETNDGSDGEKTDVNDGKIAGVFISGDVYDKTVPSTEAVQLFDDFLYDLSVRGVQVFVISGNHDSPERISFASRLIKKSGIHFSPVYNADIKPVTLHDAHGCLNIYMLPFVKPSSVRRFFPDKNIETYTDAVRTALDEMHVDTAVRNVLLCHQFVTGASRSDSEEKSVGGLDNVDADVFCDFDYVALGHIHGAQKISRDTIRYSGTPLKYSFSESRHIKSATVVEFLEKGNIKISTVPLVPERDMREIKGTYNEVTEKKFTDNQNTEDFLHVTLTDEDDVPNALEKLRTIYPNMLKLDYDNTRTRSLQFDGEAVETENKSPLELFAEFYEKQNGQQMNEKQMTFVKSLIEKIWENAG